MGMQLGKDIDNVKLLVALKFSNAWKIHNSGCWKSVMPKFWKNGH